MHSSKLKINCLFYLVIGTSTIGSSQKLSNNLPVTVGGIIGACVVLIVGVIIFFMLRYITTYFLSNAFKYLS